MPPLTIAQIRDVESPTALRNLLQASLAAITAHKNLTESVPSPEDLDARLKELQTSDPQRILPLHGVPFVAKDNIDAPPLPTTNGNAALRCVPPAPAHVIDLLMAAGAVCLGKATLDQYATGLVGTRRPRGHVLNSYDERLAPGGSSAGSAIAVASAYVAFALGTDTAGSGRVPAALNGIVGLKPSCGVVSTRGVIPACHSLDCVSVFANSVSDAVLIYAQLAHFDRDANYTRAAPMDFVPRILAATKPPTSPVAEFTFGIPTGAFLTFDDDTLARTAFDSALEGLAKIGGVCKEVEFAPFAETARLLYGGPFVAERYALHGEQITKQREDPDKADELDPHVTAAILTGEKYTASKLFSALHTLQRLQREAECILKDVHVLVVPSVPRVPTLQEVKEKPVEINAMLGTYTNFVNLLDLSAVAVPCGTHDGVPHGVTIIARALQDDVAIGIGGRLGTHFATQSDV